MSRNPLRHRDEQGSIAIFMIVVLVTTGLVMITAATVESGMRTSRRGGDSANALQVADAGVNDALTAIQSAGGTSFTRTGTVGNGSYSYTAVQDPSNPANWLIDVYGVDQTGVKRHVRAVAAGQPLFASPMYINTAFSASAGGQLDSYASGASLIGPSGNYTDGGCTDKGIMFFNPNANMQFQSGSGGGQGTSVNNCNQLRFGSQKWNYAMDGCVVYGGVMTLTSSAWGTGKCPDPNDSLFPGRTKAISQTYDPPVIKAPQRRAEVNSPTQTACVDDPSNPDDCKPEPGDTFTCNGSNPLKAGWSYYYNTVTLSRDCRVDVSSSPSTAGPEWVVANAVTVYAKNVNVSPGTKGLINPPPVATRPSICGSLTTTWTYSDVNKNPAWYYCPGWVRSLDIRLIDGTTPMVNVTGNGGKFWGTFAGPQATVSLNSPQMEFWGAMIAGRLDVFSQFSWHYDDTLSQRTTGKYSVSNWREEPV